MTQNNIASWKARFARLLASLAPARFASNHEA
jgi:hypothetical protein